MRTSEPKVFLVVMQRYNFIATYNIYVNIWELQSQKYFQWLCSDTILLQLITYM